MNNTKAFKPGLIRAFAGVSLVAVALATAACSSSSSTSTASSSSSSGTAATSAALASMLPANIRSAGVITYASAFDYPPYDYTSSSGGYAGGEIAILDAIEPLLGVQFKFTQLTEFSALVPAVADGRVEMAGESVGVTPARRQQVSYVQYGTTGEGLLVRKGNPSGISATNVCGHSISVEAGAVEGPFYTAIGQQCVKAGKKPVDVQTYATEPAQVLAVEAGHADAVGVGSTTVVSIAAKSNGSLVALPGLVPGGALPLGFIFNPSEVQLAKAFEAALNQLMQDGTLAKINNQYNMVTTLGVTYLPQT
jgi:polar amino acid transport system substrate-binding protein